MSDVLFAVLTALGAYGGFPTPPQWWADLATTDVFQLMALWVLVFQGNGKQDIVFTSIISIAVFAVMKLSASVSVPVAQLSAVEAQTTIGCDNCTRTKGSATWATKDACEKANAPYKCVHRGYTWLGKKQYKPCKPY